MAVNLSKDATAQRDVRALQLRMAGYTYEEIAKQLGYANSSGPYKAVLRLLKNYQRELAAQYKMIEGQRLEELQAAIWAKAVYVQGSTTLMEQVKAIETVLKIMKRRADLFGLDEDRRIQAELIMKGRVEIIWNPDKYRSKENSTPQEKSTPKPPRKKSKPKQSKRENSLTSLENNGKPQTQ